MTTARAAARVPRNSKDKTKASQLELDHAVIMMTATVSLLLLISCIVTAEDISGSRGNVFFALLSKPALYRSPPPPSHSSSVESSPVFPVFTRVLNAFPPSGKDGAHVSVILDEDKIEGVAYGSVVEKLTMMHAVEDFVIHFKSHTKGELIDYGAVEYGYISGEMGRQDEVLVVVRRSLTQPQRPSHDIKRFQTDLDSGVSRVYLYNGVWSNNTDLQGLNFYKEDDKTGELETLATDLSMGEGKDIALPPGQPLTIKASHANLIENDVFDIARINEVTLHTTAGRRHYVIVYGDQGEDTGVVVMGSAGYRSGAQTHHELSSDSHKLTAPLLLCLLLLQCVAITCI